MLRIHGLSTTYAYETMRGVKLVEAILRLSSDCVIVTGDDATAFHVIADIEDCHGSSTFIPLGFYFNDAQHLAPIDRSHVISIFNQQRLLSCGFNFQ
jgi:hypothetical protein